MCVDIGLLNRVGLAEELGLFRRVYLFEGADVARACARAYLVGERLRTILDAIENGFVSFEFTIKDILSNADDDFLQHGKRTSALQLATPVKAFGSSVMFYVPSSTGRGLWKQHILFEDYFAFKKDKEIDDIEMAVRLVINEGNIHIRCNCPAFKFWGYQYIASQLQYVYGSKERRPPVKRNPSQRGTVCKHCDRVLRDMKRNESRIVGAFSEIWRAGKRSHLVTF